MQQLKQTSHLKCGIVLALCVALICPSAYARLPVMERGGRGSEFVSSDLPKSVLMSVQMVGAVRQPGVHYVPVDTDLLQMLALAGGPAANAEGEVYLKRLSGSKFRIFKTDLESLYESDLALIPKLKSGDILMVPVRQQIIGDNTIRLLGFVSSLVTLGISIFVLTDSLKN